MAGKKKSIQKERELTYDGIIKLTLQDHKELTIQFINGLFGDNIPLDSEVTWLDKETVQEDYSSIIADFYPRINGKMYAIEVQQDSSDTGIALCIFKHTIDGAMHHNTASDDGSFSTSLPQPAVVFLKSTKNTPDWITWNVNAYDEQTLTLKVPTIKLKELSIKEIRERHLFPIGQFYLRSFERLTEEKIDEFRSTFKQLNEELVDSYTKGEIPIDAVKIMLDTIEKIKDKIISKSGLEVEDIMTTDILETLPVIDYPAIIKQIKAEGEAKGEARGEAKGEAKGKAEGKAEALLEVACNTFKQREKGIADSIIIENLLNIGIPEEIIRVAQNQI